MAIERAKPIVSTGLSKPPGLLLAIDPGKTTGWALFRDGVVANLGQVEGVDEFTLWLEDLIKEYGPINVIVVEAFVLFRGKAQQQIGSEFEVVQVIGICQSWALRNNVELVKQPSDILTVAQIWSKMKMPKDHSKSHYVAAYNHAFHYLVTNNMRLPEGM